MDTEYPIASISRRDLIRLGLPQQEVDSLTDADMQAIADELGSLYLTRHYQTELRRVCFGQHQRPRGKNPCGKRVTPEQAYAVYQNADGTLTYYVLKHYQLEENAAANPYARYFCMVVSPSCPTGEYGDYYRSTVLDGTHVIVNPLVPTAGGEHEATHRGA